MIFGTFISIIDPNICNGISLAGYDDMTKTALDSFSLQEMCPTSNSHMLRATMNMFDCFMDDFYDEKFMEQISDLDVRAQLEGVFFFSCIWAMGGTLEEPSRAKFNVLFRGLLERDFPKDLYQLLGINFEIPKPEKPYIFTIPAGDVFQFRYIKEVIIINTNACASVKLIGFMSLGER